ncbi:MAG: hypothetical protein AVDCRST_MAG35-1188, partial [uncultured Quadrisphaera sp.]
RRSPRCWRAATPRSSTCGPPGSRGPGRGSRGPGPWPGPRPSPTPPCCRTGRWCWPAAPGCARSWCCGPRWPAAGTTSRTWTAACSPGRRR